MVPRIDRADDKLHLRLFCKPHLWRGWIIRLPKPPLFDLLLGTCNIIKEALFYKRAVINGPQDQVLRGGRDTACTAQAFRVTARFLSTEHLQPGNAPG